MAKTLAYGYSPESTQQDLSNGYQHDKVKGLHVFSKSFVSLCFGQKKPQHRKGQLVKINDSTYAFLKGDTCPYCRNS